MSTETTAPAYLYHTTPLFHLPHLLASGAIYSATELLARRLPVHPRPSAIQRKTRLGLAGFVHLSPAPRTPLLRDKLEKGYAHVVVAFRRADVLALPGACLLRYNTKRWAHRDDFVPVTDAAEMATVWAAHDRGQYPSLEILVPGALPCRISRTPCCTCEPKPKRVWCAVFLPRLHYAAPRGERVAGQRFQCRARSRCRHCSPCDPLLRRMRKRERGVSPARACV